MQVTGFGYTKPLLIDSRGYLKENREISRYLKVGYVQDQTAKDCGGSGLNCKKKILVYNRTEHRPDKDLKYPDAGMLHKIA